ncbi:PREDICTED: trypsin-like [Ceratosolen solmsi marchali]|uniref:Trypsin-like n=1 Tax=Ceratosolen solmsi marchali TaxID=326594 RepID=A0AAJ6VK17_9HYME|nr:PREDICTED: trypsin-like [Ceratosolen solmsi marchali]
MSSFNRWFDILSILIKFAIFANLCNFLNVNALVGQNVRPAEEHEFPYVVAIMKVPKRGPQLPKHEICTGTLISLQDVLTAEHCIVDYCPLGIEIIVDSIDLLLGKKYFPLWWMTYNQWATNNNMRLVLSANDIAIIKLTDNVPNHIRLAIIATTFEKSMFGSNVQIMGWGKTNDGCIPRNLQTATLKLITNKVCQNIILRLTGDNHLIHKRRLCTVSEPYILMDSDNPKDQ